MTMALEPDFPITVIRTNRLKTVSINIEGGMVQFTVPKKLSEKKLQDLITSRTPWIQKKLRLQSDMAPLRPKEYVSGEAFTYLGRNYRLKLVQEAAGEVKLIAGHLVLGVKKNPSGELRDSFIRTQLIDWFQKHAAQRLKEKTKRYSKIIGVKPNSVFLKNYKSRWGSCSTSGDISFNWKIIIAPHHIVDYVVVHELCHLKEHNHSSSFWKCVEQVIPDYQERKNWLKMNGVGLLV